MLLYHFLVPFGYTLMPNSKLTYISVNVTLYDYMPGLPLNQRPSRPKKVKKLINQSKALELRSQGHSYSSIAKIMNVTSGWAHQLVQASLLDITSNLKDKTENYLHLQLHKYDRWLTKLVDKIDEGDVRAIEVALKIEQDRARLLNLYPKDPINIEQLHVRMYEVVSPDMWDEENVIDVRANENLEAKPLASSSL